MQPTHIAANARDPHETGTVVDQLFEPGRVEPLFAHQVEQNAGIEIAAARAHDDPAGRGQAHAGVDRLAVLDRGDAGAVAEMGDDQAIGQIVAKLAHDRFARQPVKSVALDAFGLQFLGDRQDPRDVGQFGVKGGVEARRLRQPREMLSCETDDRQGGRRMQRRETQSPLRAAAGRRRQSGNAAGASARRERCGAQSQGVGAGRCRRAACRCG